MCVKVVCVCVCEGSVCVGGGGIIKQTHTYTSTC